MRPIWRAQDRKRRRRRDELLAVCGTASAHRRHLRWGEPVDVACRQAATVDARIRRRKARRRVRRGSLRSVAADYLETYDGLTLTELATLIQRRHPDITDRQIRDAARGLLRAGRAIVDRDELGAVYRVAV